MAQGQGYSLFLTSTEAVLRFRPTQDVVRMRLVGANPNPHVTGLDPLPGTSNYLIGTDPAAWQRDVPHYAKVKYVGVYPGIDQVYYGNHRQLEYDLVVAPHVDPAPIAVAFDGVKHLSLDAEGNLVLETSTGEITQQKPMIYQDIDGRRAIVEGRYAVSADARVGFEIGVYDTTRALVIDPVLSYATYLGGGGIDVGHAVAVDDAGNSYITGETLSLNFPGVSGGSLQPNKAASYDVFVTKLNAAGSGVVYSTYLGGSGEEHGRAIAVDSSGSAYLTGDTDSPTAPGPNNVPFPITAGAVQQLYRLGPGDAFITKLNASGNGLVYSTYLGGSGTERGYGIAVDSSGSAYVTGYTNSVNGPGDFPTAGPLQSQNGGSVDAFVTKINAAGSALVYSTYLGGSGSENSIDGGAIAVDAGGNAYVGGTTSSANFPGASASTIQPTNGGGFNDGFVVKFNAAGSAIVYGTYLGGDGYDAVNGLAIGAGGDAYVVGYSDSSNFPTVAALQASRNGSGNDAFVSRLNATGSALVYSTYLGGGGDDVAYDVAVDSSGNAHIAGWTNSSNFPTVEPLQAVYGGSGDAFISTLNIGGSALLHSTYFGGSTGSEHAYGIALDASGGEHVTGQTNSTNFPLASPFQSTLGGNSDGFVLRIAPEPLQLRPPMNLVATAIVGHTVTLGWTAPVNSIAPTSYLLEGGVTPGGVLATIAIFNTATTFTVTVPTGTFYIRLHSAAAGARSVASNEIRILVNVPAAPSAPVNLLGLGNGSSLDLAWSNTTTGGTPTGIMIDVTGSVALSLSVGVTESFSLAHVPAGTYTLSLRAFNAVGTSASSNAVTLTFPGGCSGPPGPPTAFLVTANSNVVSAAWGLPANGSAPTGYTVFVSGAFTGTFATQQRGLSGAVASGTYTVSVAATNACGTSAVSPPQTVTIG